MKLIKIITHPFTLIICFSFILISGEHLGGFYLLYIFLGLPHGALHSILGVMGAAVLLISRYKYDDKFIDFIEPLLNILGVTLLSLSLVLFFYNDKSHYNYVTFYQSIPQISIGLFGLLVVVFLVRNLMKVRLIVT